MSGNLNCKSINANEVAKATSNSLDYLNPYNTYARAVITDKNAKSNNKLGYTILSSSNEKLILITSCFRSDCFLEENNHKTSISLD